jgi:uncharacterized Zn-binding protein involved in type VI secretion
MDIEGWIRIGDSSSCGGVVAEGCAADISWGKAHAFQGARMACRHNCRIAGASSLLTLSNGQAAVHHGQLTSAGCLLLSTLNGIDGRVL